MSARSAALLGVRAVCGVAPRRGGGGSLLSQAQYASSSRLRAAVGAALSLNAPSANISSFSKTGRAAVSALAQSLIAGGSRSPGGKFGSAVAIAPVTRVFSSGPWAFPGAPAGPGAAGATGASNVPGAAKGGPSPSGPGAGEGPQFPQDDDEEGRRRKPSSAARESLKNETFSRDDHSKDQYANTNNNDTNFNSEDDADSNCSRSTSSSAEDEEREAFITEINRVMTAHPFASVLSYTLMAYATLLTGMGIAFSLGLNLPQLALAVMIAAPLKRFRIPVDLAVALALSNAFPVLRRIKVGALLTVVLPASSREERERMQNNIFVKGIQWLDGPVNKYGAAFLLTRAINGLLTVSTLTFILTHGVDITPLVSWLGVSATVNKTATATAFGAVLVALSTPLRIMLLPRAVHKILPYIPKPFR